MANDRKSWVSSRSLRAPAVPIVLAISAGIVADWTWNAPFSWSISLAGCFTAIWLRAFLRSRFCRQLTSLSTISLLLACGFLGAAWHQLQWSLIRADNLLAYVTDDPRPARLRAVVESDPVIIRPETVNFPTALPKRARTVANLRALALINQQGETPVSGLVRLDVIGEINDLPPGTVIEILGVIVRPSGSRNPGGFDFRMFLRERGIHSIIHCDFPDCLRTVEPATGGLWRFVQSWQKTCANRLRERLSAANAPVAVAMLLGPRTDIPQELKDAFLQTGTVHFLAISGANVAILVIFLWPFSQVVRLSRRWRLALIGSCVWGYVAITDADPPVVRAAVIVSTWLLSLSVGRGLASLNPLALAALIIVIRNPHDLFQAGAQLSFLAILALHWLACQPWFANPKPVDPLDELTRTWWQTALAWVGRTAWTALLASMAVWVFTLPLILARFHLISPIGFVVNIFLQIWMVLTLFSGYACLAGVLVFPPLAWIVAPCFDFCLTFFAAIVRYAAAVPGGHFQVPGPPEWWLAVYCLILVVLASGVLSQWAQGFAWRLVLAWCLIGFVAGTPPRTNRGLRCTYLSVGHGVAILLEFPNRQTLLYDAGSLEDASRASQAVTGLMIERGLMRLDAALISHADIDHFNGVPKLLDDVSIGEILISPAFLDFQQESVRQVCTAAVQTPVPMRLVWAGDRLLCGSEVTIEVLHPEVGRPGGDDNANSIVLSIEYAGRRILLTGDLEKQGLLTLLSQTPRPHDILLSPHHGSLKANPPELARWAMPRWVVVSGGHDAAWNKLAENYGDGVTLLSTGKHGAITFDISSSGEIKVETHLPAVPIVGHQ